MTWDGERQALYCDHRTATPRDRPVEGTRTNVEVVPCQEVRLASTAAVARSKARASGWETNTPNGDRCAHHRVSRPRAAPYSRART